MRGSCPILRQAKVQIAGPVASDPLVARPPAADHGADGPQACDTGGLFPLATRMTPLDFQLDREFVELNQLLKLAGLCDSGGAGKALVASGEVRVDGVVELRKTCKIRSGQRVEVGNVCIHVAA